MEDKEIKAAIWKIRMAADAMLNDCDKVMEELDKPRECERCKKLEMVIKAMKDVDNAIAGGPRV